MGVGAAAAAARIPPSPGRASGYCGADALSCKGPPPSSGMTSGDCGADAPSFKGRSPIDRKSCS
eukprot:4781799-Alexandrium_andersonii.AAC.1